MHWELIPKAVRACCFEGLHEDARVVSIKGALLEGNSLVETPVRFTRLSFAMMRESCGNDKENIVDALALGFSRLILMNQEFEQKFTQFKRVLMAKLSDSKGYDDFKARESLYGTKGVDSDWASPRNLQEVLEMMCEAPPSASSCSKDDDDSWLRNEPDEEDDAAVGDLLDDDDEVDTSAFNVQMPSSSECPVTFSSAEFLRILGGDDVKVSHDSESDSGS